MSTSDSDSDSSVSDTIYENRDILSKGKQALGLDKKYVPTWTAKDAFREFFQNWMDAMIETNRLDRDSIEIIIKIEGKNGMVEYLATAHRRINNQPSGTGKLLGFIRYLEKRGTLELTNFGSQLRRKALALGETTKRNLDSLAGTHGEGFKVGSLVMVRKEYQVRIESSKYYWNMKLGGRDKRQLYCHLSPMRDCKLDKLVDAEKSRLSAGRPRLATSNIWEDVSVNIGKITGGQGKKIEYQEFLKWVKVAFALNPPSKIVNTAAGDLILDDKFCDTIFLKGLLLDNSTWANTYKFGYNLSTGTLNRDREKVSNEREEGRMIAQIWEMAIAQGSGDVLKSYTTMLLESTSRKWIDVKLAKDNLSLSTTKLVWTQVLQDDGGKSFYYEHKPDSKNSLNKIPVQLPLALWEPLRKYNLIRTPEEEQYHQLENSPLAKDIETPYSQGVQRALSAILALDPRTKELNPVFKSAEVGGIDMLLKRPDLLINSKWLDFYKGHSNQSCWLSRCSAKLTMEGFSCYHIVKYLHKQILLELSKAPGCHSLDATKLDESLRSKVHQNLLEMPRKVTVGPCDLPGEIQVSWKDPEGLQALEFHGFDMKCRVTLHRESSCSARKTDLLVPETPHPSDKVTDIAECGCPTQLVSQSNTNATFKGLSWDEEYFPMVARNEPEAFYGLPAMPISPKASNNHPGSETNSRSPSTNNPCETIHHSSPRTAWGEDDDGNSGNDFAYSSHSLINDSELEAYPKSQQSQASLVTVVTNTPISKEFPQPVPKKESGDNKAALTLQTSPPKAKLTDSVANLTPKLEEADKKTPDAVSKELVVKVQGLEFSLRAKSQLLESTRAALEEREHERDMALQEVSIKNHEARKTASNQEADHQKLINRIEDLLAEIQELQKSKTERDIEIEQLTESKLAVEAEKQQLQNSNVASHAEIEQLKQSKALVEKENEDLRDSKAAIELDNEQLRVEIAKLRTDMHQILELIAERGSSSVGSFVGDDGQSQDSQKALVDLRNDNRRLKQQVDALKLESSQARDDRTTIISTLHGVLGLIQTVISFDTKETMVSMLHHVISMIQGVLGNRVPPAPAQQDSVTIKRERIKEEPEDENSAGRASKRIRHGEVIELD